MVTCLIALGSNLGDRCAVLDEALRQLAAHPDIRLLARSAWFHTSPVGGPAGQGEFVNAAARVETSLTPEALWQVLHEIEQHLGRQRRDRWAARSIDLDLLLYGDRILHTPQLSIPHPRMAFRRFVLEPAAQIAPELRHPLWGWTLQQLRDHLDTAAPYLALTGAAGTGKSHVARQLAASQGIRRIADVAIPVTAAEPSPGINPPTPDSTAAALRAERALLRRRADLLRDTAWADTLPGTVSEFWLGQSLAYARLPPTLLAARELERDWIDLQSQVVAPKLIVLLQTPETPPPEATSDTGDATPSEDFAQRLAAELRALLLEGQYGPVLVLNANQPEVVLAEVSAAWEAMR